MKFDLQFANEEDMEYFKTLFLRNVGSERVVFDIFVNSFFVRLQIEGRENSQHVSIGLFSVLREGKSISVTQLNPLNDNKFRFFDTVYKIWGATPQEAWARFEHGEEDAPAVFAGIMQLLVLVNSVG